MNSKLPLNLDDLLRQRTVEGERIEYKAGWNPDPIIRTLCAFANDFENLGGGYVVIGQDCDASGRPIFPLLGVAAAESSLMFGRVWQKEVKAARGGTVSKKQWIWVWDWTSVN